MAFEERIMRLNVSNAPAKENQKLKRSRCIAGISAQGMLLAVGYFLVNSGTPSAAQKSPLSGSKVEVFALTIRGSAVKREMVPIAG